MDLYNINMYDERKPFDVVRAEDFGLDLYEFYEPLEDLIRKVSGVDIKGSRPVFLIGGRGTGKSMVLKCLGFDIQLREYMLQTAGLDSTSTINECCINEFLAKKDFIGVYLHFRTTEYDSMKEELEAMFNPYLSIKITEQILNFLIVLKNSNAIRKNDEEMISKYIIKQIREPILDISPDFNSILSEIKNSLLPIYETIFEKSSYYSIGEIKDEYPIPTIISKNLIFDLPNLVFTKLDNLRGKRFFILLDELEFLNKYQTLCIGQLIKDSDETVVVFKVGSRYMPQILPVGQSLEVLQEIHDFRIINIPDSLNATHSGKKGEYSRLIKNILNRRLTKSSYFLSHGISNVDDLFKYCSIEEEAINLVKKRKKHWSSFRSHLSRQGKSKDEVEYIISLIMYPTNPIIEKLNMLLYYRGKTPEEINTSFNDYLDGKDEKYKTLYEKNSFNLLFQLYSHYRGEKTYAGIDTYIHLSSGIIRNAIELCNHALNTAHNYGYTPALNVGIDSTYQDMGAKLHARIQYDDIARIPGNVGLNVRDFINEIGSIFRSLHLDRDLVEPEPTHFETVFSGISTEAKEIFQKAIDYSYLQKKPPMNPKMKYDTKKDDFLLNRIFAPYFEISYRVRGRTFISPNYINTLILGDSEKRRIARKRIIKENTKKKPTDDYQSRLLESSEV